MAGYADEQRVLLECLEIDQMVNAMRSSIPNHKLYTTIWLSTTLAPQEIARLFSLQNKPTEFPPPAPAATTLQRKEGVEQRSFADTVLPVVALPLPHSDVA